MAKPSSAHILLDNNLYSPEMMRIVQAFIGVLNELGIEARYLETEQGFREKTQGLLYEAVDGFATKNKRVNPYTKLLREEPWCTLERTAEGDTFVEAFKDLVTEKIMPPLWHSITESQQKNYQENHPDFKPETLPPIDTSEDHTILTNAHNTIKEIQRVAFQVLTTLDEERIKTEGITAPEDIDIFDKSSIADISGPFETALLQGFFKSVTVNTDLNLIAKADEAFQKARFNAGDRSWGALVKNDLARRPDASNTVIICLTDDGPAVDDFNQYVGDDINNLSAAYILSGTGFLLLLDRMIKHLAAGEGVEFGMGEEVNTLLQRDASSQFWQQSIRRDQNLSTTSPLPNKLTELVSELLEARLAVPAPPETPKDAIVVKKKAKQYPLNPNYEEHKQACIRVVEALHALQTISGGTILTDDQGNAIPSDDGRLRMTGGVPGIFTIHGSARNGLYFWPEFSRRIGDVDFRYNTNPKNAPDEFGDHATIITKQLEDEGFEDIDVFREKTRSGQISRLKFDMTYISPTTDEKHMVHLDVSFVDRVPLLPQRRVTFHGVDVPNPIVIEHPFDILANKLVAMVDSKGMTKNPREFALKQANHIFDTAQLMHRAVGIMGGGIHENVTDMFLSEDEGIFLMSPDNPLVKLRVTLEIAEKLSRHGNSSAIKTMGVYDSDLTREYLFELYRQSYEDGKINQKNHPNYPEFDEAAFKDKVHTRITECAIIGENLLAPLRAIIPPERGTKLKDVNTHEAEFVRLLQQGVIDPGMLLRPEERFNHYTFPGWRNPVKRPSFQEQMRSFFTDNKHPELCDSVNLAALEENIHTRITANTLLLKTASFYATRKGRDIIIVGPEDTPPNLQAIRER